MYPPKFYRLRKKDILVDGSPAFTIYQGRTFFSRTVEFYSLADIGLQAKNPKNWILKNWFFYPLVLIVGMGPVILLVAFVALIGCAITPNCTF